jgi:Sel1 repeat
VDHGAATHQCGRQGNDIGKPSPNTPESFAEFPDSQLYLIIPFAPGAGYGWPMSNRFICLAIVLFVSANLGCGGVSAGTEDTEFRRGLSAFNTGDYAAALSIWRPLAEQDEPRSEAGIGFMYHRGLGIAVDDNAAAIWLHRAAEQGQAEGQLMLGILFYFGQGVAQSYVSAYAWCELAGINGSGDATPCRDAALEAMSNTEREAAFRLVIELRAQQRARQ